jgi:hypothetical protein
MARRAQESWTAEIAARSLKEIGDHIYKFTNVHSYSLYVRLELMKRLGKGICNTVSICI